MDVTAKCCVLAAALALCAVLSGCGVVMEQPLPAAALSDAEHTRFEGTWVADNSDGVVSVRIDCDGGGHVASAEWKGGRFQMDETQVVFSQGMKGGEKARFLSLRVQGKDEKQARYLLLKYQFSSDDTLVVWGAQPGPFAEAIKSGRLKGQSEQHQTFLTSPPQAVLDFIDDPDDVRLFDYRKPLILRKVAAADGGPRESCGKK